MAACLSVSLDRVDNTELRQADERAVGNTFRYDIQGIRAVAVLLVVLFHAHLPVPGGYIGVDVFFVISGFVIAGQIRRQLADSGRVHLRHFYARRARRLLPASAVMSMLTLVASIVLVSPFDGQQQFAARTAAASSVSLANWYLMFSEGGYFGPAEERNPFLHTWTLSVEEQFYFVLPVALALTAFCWRRRSTRLKSPQLEITKVASAVVLCGTLASFVCGVVFLSGSSPFKSSLPDQFGFYSPTTRAWEFGAGVLLAMVVPASGLVLGRVVRWGLAFGGAGAIAVASWLFGAATPFPGTAALLPVGGALALIASGTGAPSPLGRLLEHPVVQWVGDRSYGWYLWHWPFIVLARSAFPDAPGEILSLAALVALVPAAVSYKWIEQPIRLGKEFNGRKLARLAVACVALPILAAVGVNVGARASWGLDLPAGLTEQRRASKEGCDDYEARRSWSPIRCGVGPNNPHVLVLGDSHANSAFEGVMEAAVPNGYGVRVRYRSGCPFLIGPSPVWQTRECLVWRARVLQDLHADAPAIVVVANRSASYVKPQFPPNDDSPTIGNGGQVAESRDQAIDTWTDGFTAMLDEFSRRGIPVVVLDVVPEFADDFTSRISLFRPDPGVPTVTMDNVELRRRVLLDAEHAVAARYDQVVTVDPAPALCEPQKCAAVRDGKWLWMDRNHLTPDGSRRLAPHFESAFRDLLGQ
ncbi:MAG: acyltransferase [Microthrixaceae bacterium]|nr:acyltransferase [Microthrixaceae bacterium]